ncbi:type II secretion system secretin GspD [Stenotrophomonas sp. MMGLT7]|uniref:type II secretion system secretin GspD n=1 Tax=Stenotrophomonas sp. MMGLT7 TaxID=2901227 RepID=UPI001E50FACA|nr:type II secretion system secretin GspD [Stenotrophomonas sp. MMGLT7]MCD7100007.1 type II secretion system secretin GspD [Stenotrophomonas sp. MMGLT7]
MTPRLLVPLLIGLLAGCASTPSPQVQRNAAPVPPAAAAQQQGDAQDEQVRTQPLIRRGTGPTINRGVAAERPPSLGAAGSGSATFNFEGESLAAVVKAILGDMLGQNYVIAPGVQGTVTLATPNPVSPSQALNLLEMVLGWNNARMVYSGGRYNIVPADQALAGSVAPSTAPAASARGFEARVVPLRYISASEMKKVLEPYARPNAIVNVDNGRNVITVAGTRAELENYLRTIEIFDVDWMSSMSVGVFPLQSGRADQVAADLEKVFGEESKTPSAGMLRFMPLENANAVMVITAQPSYLDQIREWLDRIDSAGGDSRLFSYELKYVKAKDLADRLAEVFGSGGGRGGDGSQASLAPGATSVQLGSGGDAGGFGADSGRGLDSSSTLGTTGTGTGTGSGGLGSGQLQLPQREGGNGSVTLEVEGDRVGVSAVDETNTLLVRATPQAWRSIREVVEKLDVMPMQVHIEAQVAEVALTGDLKYGVNWFFEQAVNAPSTVAEGVDTGIGMTGAGLASAAGRSIWGDIAGKATGDGLTWTFLGKNAAAIISALDTVSNVRLLQTPSLFVRNNAVAQLNVGSRIPIYSVSVSGISDNQYSSVQYLETGTILKVRPRVTRDGMVFLDIVQEVSAPEGERDGNGNVRINTRRMQTEAAVRAGDTVMLAGLIDDSTTDGSSGIPGLSRLPVIGALFGQKTQSHRRNEVIILLTPTIVRNPQEARDLTDEYGRRFRAMDPIPAKRP